MKIILYISRFNRIGGVERFVLNFAKRFPETLVLFDEGDSKIGEKIKWNRQYTCDIFISASAWGRPAQDQIEAKVYAQMIHADYRVVLDQWRFQYKKHPKTTHHICVSETVKKGFEESTQFKCDAVFYNFTDSSIKAIKKPKNEVLRLVTISRISKEKGFERMIEFAKLIQVPFIWEVWGDPKTDYAKEVIGKVNFKGLTTTPHIEIAKADYLVQLSDSEGNCCVINEALQMHTPVLLTPFPSGFEQISEGKNGYFIPFDLKGINFEAILNAIPVLDTYEEKTNVEDWLNLFNFAIDEFKINNPMVKVKVIAPVKGHKIGDIVELSETRATSAIDRGLVEVFIEIPKKPKKKDSK